MITYQKQKLTLWDKGNISSFALTESLGSYFGEIVFPAPVKQELSETLGNIISTPSPTCQLWIQIIDTYTVKNSAASNLTPELDWSLDANPSTSSNTMDSSQKSTVLSSQDESAMMLISALNSLQDATDLQELNENGSQELTWHGLSVSTGCIPPNTTNVTSSITGSAISSQELTHKPTPLLYSESPLPVNSEDTGHNLNTNSSQELMTANKQSVMSGTDTIMPKHSQEVTGTSNSQE